MFGDTLEFYISMLQTTWSSAFAKELVQRTLFASADHSIESDHVISTILRQALHSRWFCPEDIYLASIDNSIGSNRVGEHTFRKRCS